MANAFATLAIIMAIFIIIASQEASSRLAWSFARDDGLLLSKFMQRVHPKLDVPIYSLILTWSLVFICGLIYLGSSTGKWIKLLACTPLCVSKEEDFVTDGLIPIPTVSSDHRAHWICCDSSAVVIRDPNHSAFISETIKEVLTNQTSLQTT
jgi:hypothetical protein